LRLQSRRCSSEHASLGWHSGRWVLRDLGSSNGTTVDGRALSSRDRFVLSAGQQLRFGGDGDVWTVNDVEPPEPCAVLLGAQRYCWGHETLLVLPSSDAPEASVFMQGTEWQIDNGDEILRPESGDLLPLQSGWWRLFLPELSSCQSNATTSNSLDMALLELTFLVNAERVLLRVAQGSAEVQLPCRAALQTLLALARLRMHSKVPEPDAGWVSTAELAEMRDSSQEKVNVDIHRLRKLFQDVGIQNAAHIIERDDAKRLRIGVQRLRELRE